MTTTPRPSSSACWTRRPAPSSCSASTWAPGSACTPPCTSAREATATELAAAAGIAPRYAQEWLEQQAVAGVLDVDDVTADAAVPPVRAAGGPCRRRRSTRSPWTTSPRWPAWSSGSPRCSTRWSPPTAPAAGFRTPDTVRSSAPDRAASTGRRSPQPWSRSGCPPSGPVAERLAGGGRIADLGCGQGWSTIAVARAYPKADVWGFDARPVLDCRRARGGHRRRCSRAIRGGRRRQAHRRRPVRCRADAGGAARHVPAGARC